MSSNAWKIAMDAALECAVPNEPSDECTYCTEGSRAIRNVTRYLKDLPEPPAFRAAVEAETRELREALDACVKEFPVSSGLQKPLNGDDEFADGWGSLRAARLLLARIDGEAGK